MSPSRRPTWTSRLVGVAGAVLAVSLALQLAAASLRDAAPVLLPVVAVTLGGFGLWRWWSNRWGGW